MLSIFAVTTSNWICCYNLLFQKLSYISLWTSTRLINNLFDNTSSSCTEFRGYFLASQQ